jgi:beta-1,4-mannosyltransferase
MKKALILGFNDRSDFNISQSESLKHCGFEIETKISNKLDIIKYDLYLLNWYENIYGNNIAGIYEFIKKIFIFTILIFLRKKIIFYVHNINPHKKNEIAPNYILSNVLFCVLFFISYRVVILSMNTKDSFKYIKRRLFYIFSYKIFYIPHPNMEYLRKSEVFYNIINNNELRLLYFGQISKYKGVDVLIDAINELKEYPIKLLIAGECSKKIQYEMEKRIKNSNIEISNRYYKNEEVYDLFKQFDLCVFPLDIHSSLNSSSVILSFSMSKTVICPKIATLKDYPENLYITYSYKNQKEHKCILKQKIVHAFKMKKKNKNYFFDLGEKCYIMVREKNSQDVINKAYFTMLEGIVI